MTNRHDALADKVVKAFRNSLSDAARAQISDAEFDALAAMVREALSDELKAAADLVDGVTRRLRGEAETPELGL